VAPGLPLAEDRNPEPEQRGPSLRKKDPQNLGVEVSAGSALVADRETGAMLFAKEPDRVHSVASLTKLMTALVVAGGNLEWDTPVRISAGDLRPGGIEYFLVGEEVTRRDLLHASLIGSSNTATAALARSSDLPPEEFVARMNRKAADLGMETARFVEPTGLDPGNRASARDLFLLARAAFGDPEIAKVVVKREHALTARSGARVRRRTVKSTDLLLGGMLNQGEYRIAGGKTGTLGAETGYHVAVAVTEEQGRSVLVVVLGSESNLARFQDAKALAVWAFDAYDWGPPRLPSTAYRLPTEL
jgi:D-alanyl-D-alanine endopeptidase (penicillin-binding protein 7)